MAVVLTCLLVAAGVMTLAFALGSRSTSTGTAAPAPATAKARGFAGAPLGTLATYVEQRNAESMSLTIKGGFEPSEERDMVALLEYLGFNASGVMNRIGNTRALDGTLTAEGRLANAYWTYHPDAGLGIVFEARK